MAETNQNPLLPPSNLKTTLPQTSFSSWGAAFSSAAEVEPHDLGNFNPPSSRSTLTRTTVNDDTCVDGRNTTTGSLIMTNSASSTGIFGISLLAQESLQQSSSVKRKIDETSKDDDQHDRSLQAKKLKKEKKSKKSKTEKKLKKSKKEKKSKNSKKEKEEDTPDEQVTPTTSSASSAILEGQMVTHQGEPLMVLLDRSKHLVYAMERTDGGDLKPIGKIISGNVQIDKGKPTWSV